MPYNDDPETPQEERERRIRENRESSSHTPIGNGYSGYYGSVDEQPDNPQQLYTDDD